MSRRGAGFPRMEGSPNRQVGRGGTASGWAAAGGGGTPPYNPNQDYLPVTGHPGEYYTPDRMMTVGIGYDPQPTPTQESLYDVGMTNNASWSSPPPVSSQQFGPTEAPVQPPQMAQPSGPVGNDALTIRQRIGPAPGVAGDIPRMAQSIIGPVSAGVDWLFGD